MCNFAPDKRLLQKGTLLWQQQQKLKSPAEERKAINSAKPAGNKYMEAFRNNRGSFIVYDPAYML